MSVISTSRHDGDQTVFSIPVLGGVLGVLVFHCFFLLKAFGGVAKLLSNEPLLHLDHGWHYYYCLTASRMFLKKGVFWSYDPFLMAGYPTDLMDLSDRLIKAVMVFMNYPSPEAAYKIMVFLTGAVIPLLFYFAARLFELDKKDALVACLLGSWSWLVVGILFFKMGMTGFVLASIYGITFSALFYRHLRRPTPFSRIGLILGGPLALLIHPGILPVIGVLTVPLYAMRFKQLSLPRHLFIVAVCLISIMTNYFWVLPFLANMPFILPSEIFFQNPAIIILYFVKILHEQYQYSLVLLPWAAGEGVRRFYEKDRKDLVFVLSLGIGFFLILAFLGNKIPFFKGLEPVRFILPAIFLMIIPAATGLTSFFRKAVDRNKSNLTKTVFAGVTLIFVSSLLVFIMSSVKKPRDDAFVGLNPQTRMTINWVRDYTDRSARVMIENAGPVSNPYGDLFPLAIIAYYTKRELIGGTHYGVNLKTHVADISGMLLFGKHYRCWDRASLKEAMKTYNVGWIIVHSPWFRNLFKKYPGMFERLDSKNGFDFYKVLRPHRFVLKGSGRVTADYNTIHISGIHRDEKELIIAYHWHPLLYNETPGRLFEATVGDDPVGFIGIENPGAGVTIKLRQRFWLPETVGSSAPLSCPGRTCR